MYSCTYICTYVYIYIYVYIYFFLFTKKGGAIKASDFNNHKDQTRPPPFIHPSIDGDLFHSLGICEQQLFSMAIFSNSFSVFREASV